MTIPSRYSSQKAVFESQKLSRSFKICLNCRERWVRPRYSKTSFIYFCAHVRPIKIFNYYANYCKQRLPKNPDYLLLLLWPSAMKVKRIRNFEQHILTWNDEKCCGTRASKLSKNQFETASANNELVSNALQTKKKWCQNHDVGNGEKMHVLWVTKPWVFKWTLKTNSTLKIWYETE